MKITRALLVAASWLLTLAMVLDGTAPDPGSGWSDPEWLDGQAGDAYHVDVTAAANRDSDSNGTGDNEDADDDDDGVPDLQDAFPLDPTRSNALGFPIVLILGFVGAMMAGGTVLLLRRRRKGGGPSHR